MGARRACWWGFLLLVLAAAGQAAPTAIAAARQGEITVDGQLTEPAWAAATWATGFTLAGRDDPPGPASPETRFKVLCDEQAVYVGIECDEPEIAKLKAATPWRDGAVWQDDCVEIFFDPANDGRYYHQIMVNSRGAIYDSHAADYGLVHSRLWNGAFRAAGRVDPAAQRWAVEVVIPYGALVLPAGAGATWRWNVTRERQAGGRPQLSTWAPLQGNFHQPKLWGTLGGLPADYGAFRYRVGEPEVDVSRSGSGWSTLAMRLTARNETPAAVRLTPSVEVLEQPTVRVEGEPFDAPVGRDVAVALPPLRVQSSAATQLVFALRDPAGRLVKAVVKGLSSEYRPLQVQVLRPCYRNNIYATEQVPEIVCQVALAAQVRQTTAQVTAQLRSDTGQLVAEIAVPVAALDQPVRLPVRDLALGRYQLQVRAVSADGAEQAAQTITIRKLPPPPSGHEVRIDEHRNVVVDGRPVFCLGWYGGLPNDDPRADVQALQNIVTPEVVNPPDTSGIRKAWDERRRYTVVNVENGRLYYSFNLWQKGKEELAKIASELHTLTAPSDNLKRLAKELVETVRGVPGVLGYYLADEPEIHDIPSAYLESYYQYLCELDPYHPVFITNDTIDGIVTHGYKCADILDPDPYSSDWDYVPNFLKKVNEVAGPGKATMVTLWHSTSQTHFTQDWGSGPPYPYRVFRNQYLASVAYGAKGFTAYTTAFFMPEIEYRYGLPHVWRELRLLEPAILAPAPAEPVTAEGAPELACWARTAGGHVYVVAVNHKPGACEATIRWPGLGARTTLPVMSEGRAVAVAGGAFRDRFEEGDAHVYTDDPAALKLPTTTEVTTELERRKQEAVKPGNLCHVSRGVKARASEGYFAPWFTQYFYYAINGLTDDQGWSATHAGGQPSWLEVTLPAPAEIGRVVLFTPNLRDYDVDLIGPDGATSRFEVRGNTQTEVTHRLRPAVPCLKIKVTASATRGGPATVAELEAYADTGDGPAETLRPVADAAPVVQPLFAGAADEPVWSTSFDPFETAPQFYWDARDTKWVLNAAKLQATPRPGGGVTLASVATEGYASMGRILPYQPAGRFLQTKLDSLDGEGYRFGNVIVGNSSGKPGYRSPVNVNRPGVYTLDTWHVHDNYRTGQDQTTYVRLGCAGSKKLPDGTVAPGPRFTWAWLRFVPRPTDALIVTRADGAPLGDVLRQGDTLHCELLLAEPATDAVVEVQAEAGLRPLPLNGAPYLQLRRADETGRVWVGLITLGPGTGKCGVSGYPVVFKAAITGGALKETFAPFTVAFE